MDRQLRVRTPESIAFSYELAGLGSRFLAVAVDVSIQIVVLLTLFWGLTLAAPVRSPAPRQTTHLSESLAVALIIAIVFLVFFGYFIAFETLWNGQTPGKKLLGLRVVRDGGYPIDFPASAIRNLVRVGEFAVGFYAISAVAAVLSAESKRLGDMAAGTIVVRDAKSANLETILARSRLQSAVPAAITQEEHALVDRFVARRSGMHPAMRSQIAAQLAQRVRPRVPADLQRLDDEGLLERISAS